MKPKKNSKVDLTKRTVLFLQLGLILVLLLAYLGIEWKTYEDKSQDQIVLQMGELEEEVIPITEVVKTLPPKLPEPPELIIEVPDEDDVKEDKIASTEPDDQPFVEPEEIIEAPKDDPIEPVPFTFIENVPVYPGCEGLDNNEERKKCMSEKITEFVNKRFNRELGGQLGLTGINRVTVMFMIDTEGNITDVQSRAPHPKLEEEAKRVINALPKMQPGKQRGKPVPVSYALPILFQVQN